MLGQVRTPGRGKTGRGLWRLDTRGRVGHALCGHLSSPTVAVHIALSDYQSRQGRIDVSLPVSDAAFELLGACVHSLRFGFGGPLDYPYAPARLATENPPPALFRRLVAASPPPSRAGAPWQTGMTLDGRLFDPSDRSAELDKVRYDEGTASLDAPD